MAQTRTKGTPVPVPDSPARTHRWQWSIAILLIAGVVAVCAFALVREPPPPLDAPTRPQAEPIAVVHVGLQRFGIDANGIRLAPPDGRQALLVITGHPSSPRGRVGEPWGIESVEAAARLAAFVAAERERLQLISIEIVNQGIDGELRLRTVGSTRVIWSRLPEIVTDRIVPPDEKLARLQAYIAEHGSLDKPEGGPYMLDVRPAGGMTRKEMGAGK